MNRVEQAQARASITGLLSTHAPEALSSKQVAEALGCSGHTAGQLMSRMAKDGLITGPIMRGKQKTFAHRDLNAAEEPPRKKVKAVVPKEIELVIEGFQVILGRNPATGRFRVVLEDIS